MGSSYILQSAPREEESGAHDLRRPTAVGTSRHVFVLFVFLDMQTLDDRPFPGARVHSIHHCLNEPNCERLSFFVGAGEN